MRARVGVAAATAGVAEAMPRAAVASMVEVAGIGVADMVATVADTVVTGITVAATTVAGTGTAGTGGEAGGIL